MRTEKEIRKLYNLIYKLDTNNLVSHSYSIGVLDALSFVIHGKEERFNNDLQNFIDIIKEDKNGQ